MMGLVKRTLAALTLLALGSTAGAQPAPRRQASPGLEMTIEGDLKPVPGGTLRWFVTLHEVVAGRDLRPAPGASLRMLASFRPSEPVATAVTDARGRATLSLSVPDDLEGSFRLVVEASSPRGAARRFELTTDVAPRYRLELFVDQTRPAPGGALRAWGRLIDRARGRPAPRREVSVELRAGGRRMLGVPRVLVTEDHGLFETILQAPAQQGAFVVTASARGAAPVTRHLAVVEAAAPPPLVVLARPARPIVAPGAVVQVAVTVRTPEGEPVPGAQLTGLSLPAPTRAPAPRPVLTDAHGRATVPWRPRSAAALADVTGEVQAVREGLGVARGSARVRVARGANFLAWAVEGAAFVPGLSARIFARVVRADGRPLVGATVRLEGSGLAAGAATTDPDGVAAITTTIAEGHWSPGDRCGGATAVAATARVGTETHDLCLPVDPDATLGVHAGPVVAPGRALEVRLERRPAVLAAPIVVTALAQRPEGGWRPIAQTVVAGRTSRATLALPPEAGGLTWIRARPLTGAGLQEVRGGGTLVWAQPGRDAALRVTPGAGGGVALALDEAGAGPWAGFALALPLGAGRELLGELRAAFGHRPEAGATRLAAFLAAHAPRDLAVSAVLREREVVPLAMPGEPAAEGLLRDPWRTRARLIRGRLGRLFRKVEQVVATHSSSDLELAAVHDRGRWRLNREILAEAVSGLDEQGLVGLDGAPLTIEVLEALDPAFVYDSVARRITRQRLLKLLVALRGYVREHGLDLAWARRGDPSQWLGALVGGGDQGRTGEVERGDLFDAWGRPFALRRAPGGRARFAFLEPVVGYELLSAGPDGRLGTRDDVFDPFARVLPAGGLYAEAVGEEALLARLRGVELGRATVDALATVFAERAERASAAAAGGAEAAGELIDVKEAGGEAAAHRSTTVMAWEALPSLLEEPGDEWPAPAARSAAPSPGGFARLEPAGGRIALGADAEPRRALVVGGAFGHDGTAVFGAAPLATVAPLVVSAAFPERLRVGERLRVPVRVTVLERAPLDVQVRAQGAVEAALVRATPANAAPASAPASGADTVWVEVRGARPGVGQLVLSFAAGPAHREIRQTVGVTWDGALRARHAGLWVRGRAETALEPAPDARPIRSLLVVSAPRALARDPGWDGVRQAHPELLAWAHAVSGDDLPRPLIDDLVAHAGREDGAAPTPLANACAAVAWSVAAAAARAAADPTAARPAEASVTSAELPRALARL
ncbi:MAG TPA: hypothetical protein VGQ83_24360, partial [Polyangia bacterium]